ncbi:unnamed protein product [Anisakis simplex]|uniref:DUF2892 domain-containing protein n=1 Tax=Anisakis simplex TaxID=6269 RepID=A0A0M3IY99_ANISI|nr:unnamed protein product [Anisakis simplex]
MGSVFSTKTNNDVDSGVVDRLSRAYDQQILNQIALHNLQFEQRRSVELATNRESIGWELMAASTVTVALVMTAAFLKNKFMAVPIIALVMGAGYRYDKCYGEHDQEIRECAERLLGEDRRRFEVIGGAVTLSEIDERIKSKKRANK